VTLAEHKQEVVQLLPLSGGQTGEERVLGLAERLIGVGETTVALGGDRDAVPAAVRGVALALDQALVLERIEQVHQHALVDGHQLPELALPDRRPVGEQIEDPQLPRVEIVPREHLTQKEWCFPIDPAMRLLGDMIEWCSCDMPRWHPVSISGYHIREAGATAAQELAFTLKDGFTYVEHALERGLNVDDFAPRLSFFFNAQIDFFEEIAKYRAARRIWARELRDTYGARSDRSLLMRFHTQTAGVSLTAQQPLNNIIRTAIEALAGVLGGTQSLHTNSYDEALALPTEEAVRIALRTQQIIAHETGVANTVDPLGGSYFVEALTDELERQAYAYFARIDELGGMVAAVKGNFPQREIANAAFDLQAEIEAGRRIVVGLNPHTPRAARTRPRPCASTRRSSASSSGGYRPSARRATLLRWRPRSPRCVSPPKASGT
jgi:methylmalonyl-CoA mutase N-terminal domain/subunit